MPVELDILDLLESINSGIVTLCATTGILAGFEFFKNIIKPFMKE